ncbi:histidine kinase [Nocardioides dubius]|uniref:histidine kinase n=1 Tax=Nocardioides dubius TaxID=317019 RepID=A0ABP4EH33_9ACTN
MTERLRDIPRRFIALAVIGAVATWYLGQRTWWNPWLEGTENSLSPGWAELVGDVATLVWAVVPLVALLRPWLALCAALVPYLLLCVVSVQDEIPVIWALLGSGRAVPITLLVAVAFAAMVGVWHSKRVAAAFAVAYLVPVAGYCLGFHAFLLPFGDQVDSQYATVGSNLVTFAAYGVVLGIALGIAELLRRGVLKDRRAEELETRSKEMERESIASAERARLARDLHDVVAHHVSLIAVRAETAPYTVDDLSPAAAGVLEEIASDSRTALDELRGVLGVLRRSDEAPALSPLPQADQIGDLIEQARAAGGDVSWQPADLSAVTPSAGHVAYRVVQEALTNARRHSPGAPIQVLTLPANGGIVVQIVNRQEENDGTEVVEGRGLVGMRERVEALGGVLTITAGPELVVHAEIPAEGR